VGSDRGRRGLRALLVAVSLAWVPTHLDAHTLESATARVTFRAGHVEVRLHVDPLRVMAAESSAEVPLGHLALVDPPAFEALAARALAALVGGAHLDLDGAEAPLQLTAAPTTEALLALGRRALMAGEVDPEAHPVLVEVVLEARLTRRPAGAALSLPTSLGPTLVTWLEPEQAFLIPGATARFSLRSAP